MEMTYCMFVGTRKWFCFNKLWVTPILVDHETGCIENLISLAFHAHEEHPNWGRTRHVCQFEGNVVTDSELEINMKNWYKHEKMENWYNHEK
jgi:hypothetical protein